MTGKDLFREEFTTFATPNKVMFIHLIIAYIWLAITKKSCQTALKE
jgi:hypothetical protein